MWQSISHQSQITLLSLRCIRNRFLYKLSEWKILHPTNIPQEAVPASRAQLHCDKGSMILIEAFSTASPTAVPHLFFMWPLKNEGMPTRDPSFLVTCVFQLWPVQPAIFFSTQYSQEKMNKDERKVWKNKGSSIYCPLKCVFWPLLGSRTSGREAPRPSLPW